MELLYQVLTLLLSYFSFNVIRHLFLSRQLKRTENLIKSFENTAIANHFSEEFNDSFFQPNIEEAYFEARTEINIESKNIQKIIEFKNTFAEGNTWSDLKKIISYIEFDENRAILKISRPRLILYRLYNIIGFIFLITGILYAYFNPIEEPTTTLEKINTILPAFGFELVGFFMIFLVMKIGRVKKILRRIEKRSA